MTETLHIQQRPARNTSSASRVIWVHYLYLPFNNLYLRWVNFYKPVVQLFSIQGSSFRISPGSPTFRRACLRTPFVAPFPFISRHLFNVWNDVSRRSEFCSSLIRFISLSLTPSSRPKRAYLLLSAMESHKPCSSLSLGTSWDPMQG